MNPITPNRRFAFGRAGLLAAALAAILPLSACFQNEPGDAAGPSETDEIRIKGRVVASNSSPIAGVVVRLARNGVTDTTDALGRYQIHKAEIEDEGTSVLDTLYYTKNGQSLARVSVVQWVDSLPDIQVIQRDISGLLTTNGVTIARVEAVVTGDGIDSANPVTADFYYNALTGNYSGFVYFPPASSVQNYEVVINVYGPGDIPAGQSQVVPFNSFAGNITVPSFSAGNALPMAKAGVDTAVALGAAIQLRGTAVDSFGSISKWEWSIGGGPFVETSSGDTSFSRSAHGAYPCILRVTDNDGNTAVDTAVMAVLSHGTAWTARTSNTTASLTSVIWAGTQFVAVGSGATVVTSPDGITWTPRIIDTTQPPTLNDVAWSGQKLIAVSSISPSQEHYYSSADGITWTSGQFTGPVGIVSGLTKVSAAESTLIVASQSNTSRFVLRSTNHGATWIVDSLPRESGGLLSAAWTFTKHAGRLVGLGGNGAAFSTVSGGTWVRHTESETFPRPSGGVYDYTMMSVVSTGAHAVAVGYAGHVMRSTDGMTWQQPRVVANIPEQGAGSSAGNFFGVAWTGNALFAVGSGYTVASADGGANWAQIQAGNNMFRSIAWNGTRLVAVGSSGTIITSP